MSRPPWCTANLVCVHMCWIVLPHVELSSPMLIFFSCFENAYFTSQFKSQSAVNFHLCLLQGSQLYFLHVILGCSEAQQSSSFVRDTHPKTWKLKTCPPCKRTLESAKICRFWGSFWSDYIRVSTSCGLCKARIEDIMIHWFALESLTWR